MAGGSRRTRPDDIWEDAHEVPVAGIKHPSSMRWRAKWGRIAVWMVLILAPLAVLVSFSKATQAPANAEALSSAQSSPGQATAQISLQAWLSASPSPLPGGTIVSWAGATTVTPPPETRAGDSEQIPQFPLERDRFVVIDDQGRGYHADLLVEVDPAGGAKVVGGPAIEPIPQARDRNVEYPEWGGLARVQVPDPVTAAVKGWAAAYTSGDPAALTLAVGDQDSGHTYLPLQGVSTTDVRSVIAAVLLGDQLAVRVELALSERASISYDVLVQRASTAAPVVVAWGAPGAGSTLTPYGNALPRDIAPGTAPTISRSGAATTLSKAAPATSKPAGTSSVSPPRTTTAPKSTAPRTTEPRTTAPKSTAPRTTAPKSTAPKSTAPRTTAPTATAPKSTAPRATAPNSTAPTATAPTATAPKTTTTPTTTGSR